MTWVLTMFVIGWNGVMFLEPAGKFTSKEHCEAYAKQLEFIIEKTESNVRNATHKCVGEMET